jgi:hypothetical protein
MMNSTHITAEYEPEWWERLLQVLFFIIPALFAGLAALANKKNLRKIFYKTKAEKEKKVAAKELYHTTIDIKDGVLHLRQSVEQIESEVRTLSEGLSQGSLRSTEEGVGHTWLPAHRTPELAEPALSDSRSVGEGHESF